MGSNRTYRSTNADGYGLLRHRLSSDDLLRMYSQELLTDQEISLRYGVTDVAVQSYRRSCGIPSLSFREREDIRRRRQGLPVLADLTPVQFMALYQQMGAGKIAAMFGVTKPTVLSRRRKFGIEPISKTDRATSVEPFTDEQQEIVYGTLLGDGHVLARGAYKISHSHSQLGYLRDIHRRLAPFAKPIFFGEKVMDSGTVAYEFGFLTRQHVWLQEVRRLFYPDGEKVFPELVLRSLTARALAYWYFDDGYMDAEAGLPSFALGDVSQHTVALVIGCLEDRFGIKAYHKPQSSPTCQIVGVRASSTDVLFSLVTQFATTDLLYKIPVRHRPKHQRAVRPILTRPIQPFPKPLGQRCRRWNGDEDRQALLDDLMLFWRDVGFPFSEPRVEDITVLTGLTWGQVIKQGDILKRHSVGQSICHAMMPHIWDTKSHAAKYAPKGLFEDDGHLRDVLTMVLNLGRVPNAASLRSGLRLRHYSGAYNFRPAVAKVLVDRFCPPGGRVFDPCGGWGGRMLGTLTSAAEALYEACEPQPETCAGLRKLSTWVGEYVPGASSRVTLHDVPMEDVSWPVGVDVVFTSPPYWKKMAYGEGDDLAGNRYPTYESWREGFLRELIRRAYVSLKPGGWFVLNVDDVRIDGQTCPINDDVVRIATSVGFGDPVETYRYDMSRPDAPDNHEKVFCWARGSRASVFDQDENPTVVVNRCDVCGKPTTVGRTTCPSCMVKRDALKMTCAECGDAFEASRSSAKFCSEACGARSRRRHKREQTPVSKTRTFTCQACDEVWETSLKGNFHWCPTCREQREICFRKKTCSYRECGQTFTDTTRQNGLQFCCVEHRRREKMFRQGKVTSADQFRKPDPVLTERPQNH